MERGKLTIFTSYTPGAGKSYFMVSKAMQRRSEGMDVVIGFLNGRHREIDKLQKDNGVVEEKNKRYSLKEIISKSPDLVVMDELGMHHLNKDEKSFVYEDVDKILEAGIDVYASTNLKKFASLNPLYKNITGIGVKKPIPDKFLDEAEHIFFIDREPELMIKDFEEGSLFGERYMKTRIMNKNFEYDTLCAYREVSKKCLEKYRDKTSIVERELM